LICSILVLSYNLTVFLEWTELKQDGIKLVKSNSIEIG